MFASKWCPTRWWRYEGGDSEYKERGPCDGVVREKKEDPMVEGKGVEPDGGGKGDKGMDLMVKVAGSSMPRAPGLVQHLLVDLVPVINQHNLPPPSLTHHGPSEPHQARPVHARPVHV